MRAASGCLHLQFRIILHYVPDFQPRTMILLPGTRNILPTNPISKAHFRQLYLELKRAEEASETAHQENVVEVSAPSTTLDATSLARVEQELVGLRAELLLLRRFLSKMLALGLVLGVLGLVAVWVAIVLRFAV